MDMKKTGWLLIGLLLLSSSVHALECDVKFRAKRVKSVEKWYGSVDEPEFKSGIAAGNGADKQECLRDALAEIRADGWSVTYSEIISSN